MNEYSEKLLKTQKEWEKRAKSIKSPEELAEFAEELLEKADSYELCCYATTYMALAGSYLISNTLGITNWQASSAMWLFIKNWNFKDNKLGLKLLDYDLLLYPQYKNYFDKTITSKQFKELQKIAEKRLEDNTIEPHPDVKKHWESIIVGKVPFGFKIKDDGSD